jgi:ABC-2 type transport system permease protein
MTQTTQFTPTLMQKLLGRQYKWWYIFQFYLKVAFNNRMVYIFMVLRYLVPVFILLTVFYTTGSKSLVSYYLVATLLYYLLVLPMNISYEMKDGVLFGRYTRLLLLPINFRWYLLAQSIGILSVPTFMRFLIFIFLFPLLGVQIFFGISTVIALLLAFVGVGIGFGAELLIGTTSFWSPDNKFLLQAYQDILAFIAGGIIPLTGNLSWLSYFPFSFAIYHPMQIYLGKYDTNQTLIVFAGGIAWCIIVYFLAKFIFRLGLKRNEAVGLK